MPSRARPNWLLPAIAIHLAPLVFVAALVAPTAAAAEPESAPLALRERSFRVARELLARAKQLDAEASSSERAAAPAAAAATQLRNQARWWQARADATQGAAKADAEAQAQHFETDAQLTEIEATTRLRMAAERRQAARDLRRDALRAAEGKEPLVNPDAVVATAPTAPPPPVATQAERTKQPACSPQPSYTADGRKIYRVECNQRPIIGI